MGSQGTPFLRGTLYVDIDSSSHTQSHNLTARTSNFEDHNVARHTLSLGVGRHLWLGTPYSMNIRINIIVDQLRMILWRAKFYLRIE
jgi:hypothetical protein